MLTRLGMYNRFNRIAATARGSVGHLRLRIKEEGRESEAGGEAREGDEVLVDEATNKTEKSSCSSCLEDEVKRDTGNTQH